MVKCVVTGCQNRVAPVNVNRGAFNRPPKRFFNFPKDPARVKVWLAALRESDKQDSSEQHLICEDHFLPEDVSASGVNDDVIPIMPPCLDGPMGGGGPCWGGGGMGGGGLGVESEEERDESWDNGGEEEEEEEEEMEEDVPVYVEPPPPTVKEPQQQDPAPKNISTATPGVQQQRRTESKIMPRTEVALVTLTQRFMELMMLSPDCTLDLRQVTRSLNTRRRRVYDITGILQGINLIEKQSVNRIKWIGRTHISSFLWSDQQKFQRELDNLKVVEDTLDSLIKSCATQLFEMTDEASNAQWAFVTREDVGRLGAFQEQTVIVVKAPEETKLEVPAPTEDSIQAHLKGVRGPIDVWTCEVPSDSSSEKNALFHTLQDSRIHTATLHTESSSQQGAVQSA